MALLLKILLFFYPSARLLCLVHYETPCTIRQDQTIKQLIDTTFKIVKDLHGKKVLELGCGAALPGLFCLKNGQISELHLQDFNSEVIEHVTKPNIALNQSSMLETQGSNTRFFSG